MATTMGPESMHPGEIRKLDQVVVNRIAAGEIIQRPANALKELLENSLDAKATSIQITVKGGGMKFLQIQDNGTGIRKQDMQIVCERFTTSKLRAFEDLTTIATFGFRGEALASITHVAHLTIQTKTSDEVCAYKGAYADGKLKAPLKSCAGNQGTTITIEDLFYNTPQRKQGLKSPAEEFQRISDVVSKYSIHNSGVAFTLKKFGEQPSIKTAVGGTQLENIRLIYGMQISRELLPMEMVNDMYKFRIKGLVTKVNYSSKKAQLLLFINHRLVESTALRLAVDAVYSSYLPKGTHPFLYLSLEINPNYVDVNVHPTKHEVHFLYQDEIIEIVKNQIEARLLKTSSTRTLYTQIKLPGFEADNGEAETSLKLERTYAKDMVRTDAKEQKLDKFFKSESDFNSQTLNNSIKSEEVENLEQPSQADNPITSNSSSVVRELASCKAVVTEKAQLDNKSRRLSESNLEALLGEEPFSSQTKKQAVEVDLTSVLNMRKSIEDQCSILLRSCLKDMVFVGVVDAKLALFQHGTKLYLCNTFKFSRELFYQRLVYGFQNFEQIKIEPSLPVRSLILLALNSEDSGWTEEDGSKEELAERATEILMSKAQLMRVYFGVSISDEGDLTTLPVLIENHCPSPTFLPNYLLRLATDVSWDTEEECFDTFCRETAEYYAHVSRVEAQADPKTHKWRVEFVIYPAMKQYLLPANRLKKHLYELTNLPKLYKVFERC